MKNNRNDFRYSIKWQLPILFTGLMALIILIVWVVNNVWLEDYYIREKSHALMDAYDQLAQALENETFGSEEFTDELEKKCDKYSMDVLVIDSDSQVVLYTGRNPEDLRMRIWDHLFLDEIEGMTPGMQAPGEGQLMPSPPAGEGTTAPDDVKDYTQKRPVEKKIHSEKVLISNDDYEITVNRDDRSNSEYIDLIGTLADGDNILIRSPLESIQLSVDISNRFLAYIGIIALLITAIVIWLVSRKISRPVMELADISKKMASLDFDAKYRGKAHNEIAVLGENINKLSDSLESTISELKTANNELQKDIEHKTEIDEMRKEFLSNVSHELKTPIAIIQGYAEGLSDGVNDGDPESQKYYSDVIVDEAKKMNTMVQKLLSLNQLEFGENVATMERFDILALIKAVVESSQILAEAKDIDITYSQGRPLYVWGDEFMVEEVVTNYLSNAINHCSGDKKIDIKVEEKDGTVRTTVFNTGDPIPEESIDKIWTKFYKVDKARTRAYGGSGIGLSIVKAIMESMNQNYGVKNYDNGVAFWFELSSRSK